MKKNNEDKKYKETKAAIIQTSKTEIKVITDKKASYPYCALPPHYFDWQLAQGVKA